MVHLLQQAEQSLEHVAWKQAALTFDCCGFQRAAPLISSAIRVLGRTSQESLRYTCTRNGTGLTTARPSFGAILRRPRQTFFDGLSNGNEGLLGGCLLSLQFLYLLSEPLGVSWKTLQWKFHA